MDDNNIAKTIIENSGNTINQFYNDAISPAAKAAGNIIALPLQAIDVALTKPKLWVAEGQYNYKKTLELLGEKMKNVPPENIEPPENYVAVPALQQISYCFDSNELRDMYANLLSSSMQKDKKWEVHPSFVEIIKQLLPDEAKLIKHLMKSKVAATLTLRAVKEDETGFDILNNYSLVGYEAGCDSPNNVGIYIDNLSRLGLIINYIGIRFLTEKSLYEKIKSDRFMKIQVEKILKMENTNKPEYEEGYIELSDLGKNFCKVCIK